MTTQTVVCPSCGRTVPVNVIPGKRTTTRCQNDSCRRTIQVYADKKGQIRDIDTGCLIATACMELAVDPDTVAEQLAILRTFRDQVVKQMDGGQDLLAEYYQLAPLAVTCIAERPDAARVLRRLYEIYIYPAVRSIEAGDAQQALTTYSQLITLVKSEYLALSGDGGISENLATRSGPLNPQRRVVVMNVGQTGSEAIANGQ